ncbi:ribosomal RNA small subunit methyltransferase NEP1-like [Watersipora subatra]|uniref:ribosomal RNA small subunit methyltransferase NEP1-like n=1 Tax=Watersipora subatra TaxID=2589382 RepID=UPI00355B89E9
MAGKAKRDDSSFKKLIPHHLQTLHERDQSKRLIVILEGASLETIKVGKQYELINCDKHKPQMRKHKKDFSQCRPDITHQCLLMLMDSPLNRAGLLQVYIHTASNQLIEISPQTRIPRTFDRFCGLMVQLLFKLSISASDAPNKKLLKLIKNPVTDHLPTGCRKICMTYNAEKCVKPAELVPEGEVPIAIVVGAIAIGSIDPEYTEENIAISNYPLSAALTCSKLCNAFEEAWAVEDKVAE